MIEINDINIPLPQAFWLNDLLERIYAGEDVSSYADEAKVVLDGLAEQLRQRVDPHEQEEV